MGYQLFAICPDETTELVADEIRELGGTAVRTGFRVVYFQASEEVYYRTHLHSRLASRIFRVIKDIPAGSPQIIFDKTRRIKFHEYFAADQQVRIKVVSAAKETSVPTHLVGSKIREALEDSAQHFCGRAANINSFDAKVCLKAFLHENRMMLSLDTSLTSLHKRGHRVEGHPAPIKETLAAALLRVCGYDGQTPLYDPMCGSGTIIIEGAQIAIRKAPLIHRKKGEFGFEYLKDFNAPLWRKLQDEARRAQLTEAPPLFASDISADYLDIARQSALKARVERHIDFKTADFFKTQKPAETGLLVANLPYGERLDETDLTKEYVRAVGDHLKQHFKGWRCGLLMPASAPFKDIGLKVEQRVSLQNGSIPVKFVVFSVY